MENDNFFDDLYNKYKWTPFFELEIVSRDLCDKIKKDLYKLSDDQRKWETIPFNLMWFPIHKDYIQKQFFKSINQSVLIMVWWWSLEKLKDYLARIEDPSVTLRLASKISLNIADISTYDFWPEIEKDFWENIKFSILPIFMTWLRNKIRKLEDSERKTEWRLKKFSKAIKDIMW